MREGITSRVTAADRLYDEFYNFYSVSLEYFGYTHLRPTPPFTIQNKKQLHIASDIIYQYTPNKTIIHPNMFSLGLPIKNI
jgi:hypothetical protein